MENFTMIATTLFGLEEVLAGELRSLGAMDVQTGVRSVSFVGDKGFMYKANLSLRTAIRILKPIQKFTTRQEHEMYEKVKKMPWNSIIGKHRTFAIDAIVNSNFFTSNSHYIALKVKDAIVDNIREKTGDRPNVDIKHPDVKIHVHIVDQTCQIALDSSGDSLHKRGYRDKTNLAPINEVLAAGMILLSGYNGKGHFIDPMCGSGTILIEAAMIAAKIPANINRKEFAFEKWADFDIDLFEKIHASVIKRIENPGYKIIGYDKAPSAVRKARENIKNAELQEFIEVREQNFFDSEKDIVGPVTLLFNPPYGERLPIDAEKFYKKIGDTLKQNYPGTEAWFITSDIPALKYVGLRTSRKIALKNGKLDCKFVRYEMYEGSKKDKR
jgi:putative N6-adenine-specific DNA methylase